MYPANFEYVRAGSVEEAIQLLGQHENAKLLAGGHSLLPMMKLRLADPAVLIDIGRIAGMSGVSSSGGSVSVGALSTHAEIAAADGVPGALSDAANEVGDQQVRNRGTIGGNVAHADPASDLPTVLVALDATIHMTGPGGARSVSAEDCFIDLFTTALGSDEVMTSISMPAEGQHTGSAYAKLEHPASRYALVGAAASVTLQGNTVTACRVAVGGLTPAATRCASVEAALTGQKADADAIAAAAEAVAGDLGDIILGDLHAGDDYRRAMAAVFVRRALEAAAARAK
jgi:carbon-monoxide dehydrogenase medium subunit